MNFPAREMSNIKVLEQSVSGVEAENGRFDIRVDVSGHDGVPLTLEFAFRRGGRLVGVVPSPESDDDDFLEQGMGRYEVARHFIEFGPGRAVHRRTRLEGEIFDMHRGTIRPDALHRKFQARAESSNGRGAAPGLP